jgi:tagatose 6-phosphate kinase
VILCVGLSPTVQRILFFESLELGAVNRAQEVIVNTGGKALGVARVFTLLGGEACLVQVLGGDSGRFIEAELDKDGVRSETVWAQGDLPTRVCTTLIAADGSVTELVEESRPLAQEDIDGVIRIGWERLSQVRALCLSGSFPEGVPADFYVPFVAAAYEHGIPCIVDAQRTPLRLALEARPFLVKPNLEEAARTLGIERGDDPVSDARAAARGLVSAGAKWAMVSMGATGSLLGNANGECWLVAPPEVQVRNPIGSGDALAAGLLYALLDKEWSVPQAAVFGTACAAANCLTKRSSFLAPESVRRLLSLVRLTALD